MARAVFVAALCVIAQLIAVNAQYIGGESLSAGPGNLNPIQPPTEYQPSNRVGQPAGAMDIIGKGPDKKLASRSHRSDENHHQQYGTGACKGVTIVNIGRSVSFHQCQQICHDHDGHFFAPSSHAEGVCLENVPGAQTQFWVNTLQVFPHWSSTEGSYLVNVFQNQKVPNYSPIVNRNKPNGIMIRGGYHAGKGKNCLLHSNGQLIGTACDEHNHHGVLANGCACSIDHEKYRMPCESIKIVQTRDFIHSRECQSLCGADRFFAPSNKHELECLNKNALTHHPTWVNLMQFLTIPDSKTFPAVANIMTSKMVFSFATNRHEGSPFNVKPDEAYLKGVAQNCVYYKKNGDDLALHATRCHTGQMTRQCACVPQPNSMATRQPNQMPAGQNYAGGQLPAQANWNGQASTGQDLKFAPRAMPQAQQYAPQQYDQTSVQAPPETPGSSNPYAVAGDSDPASYENTVADDLGDEDDDADASGPLKK